MLEKLFKNRKRNEETTTNELVFEQPTVIMPTNEPRHRTGVCFYDRKVWVNHEKKVVAVKQYAYVDLTRDEFFVAETIPEIQNILDNYRDVHPSGKCNAHVDSRGYLVIEATGVARCNEVDEFDEDLGVKLATTRAQERIFAAAGKFFDTIVYTVQQLFMFKFEDYVMGNYNAAIQCVLHAFELQGVEDCEN